MSYIYIYTIIYTLYVCMCVCSGSHVLPFVFHFHIDPNHSFVPGNPIAPPQLQVSARPG